MSKYYKVEDITELISVCEWRMTLAKERHGEGFVDYSKQVLDVDELNKRLYDLPTIEVSEDCISREDAIKAYNEAIDELVKAEMEEFNLGDFTECSFNTTQLKLIARKIENAPSVIPKVNKDEWVEEFSDDGWRWVKDGL